MHALTDEPRTGPGAAGGDDVSDRELAAHLVRLSRQIDRLAVAVDNLEADLAARLPAPLPTQRADEPGPPAQDPDQDRDREAGGDASGPS